MWDGETGLYDLRSRQDDPSWGRFINADRVLGETGILLSHNVLTYCANKPTVVLDLDRNFFMLIAAAIGAVVGALTGGLIAASNSDDILEGAVKGALDRGDIGLMGGAAAGIMLAGSATASVGAVATGAHAL